MEEKIMQILCDICGAAPGEFPPDIALFDEGLLDSFGIVQLLAAVEEQLGLTLDIETMTRADIATPALLVALVEGLTA